MPEQTDHQRIARSMIPIGAWGDTLEASYYGTAAVAYGDESIQSLRRNGINAPQPLFQTEVSNRQRKQAERTSKKKFTSGCVRCNKETEKDDDFKGAIVFGRGGDVLVYNDARDLSNNLANRFGDIGGTTINPSNPYSSTHPITNLFFGDQTPQSGVLDAKYSNDDCQQVIDDCKSQHPGYKDSDDEAKAFFACVDAGGCRDATVDSSGGNGILGGLFDPLTKFFGDWKNVASTLLIFALIGGAALLITSQGLKKVNS